MTKHDKFLFEVAKSELKKGAKWLEIGKCVVSRKKIVAKLQKLFPKREIRIGGSSDYRLA